MQENRLNPSAGAASGHDETAPQKLFGVVAEYGSPDELMAAASRVRDAGYTRWDAITPFPVHGIEEAMGIKPTILPWFTLCLGLTGTSLGLFMQWYTNAVQLPYLISGYPFLISGKPMFSLPANIPVSFELTILFAAFTTFLVMLALNLLPELFHPLFRHKRMQRFTSDRFALVIEAKDPLFDRARAEALLAETGGAILDPLLAPTTRAPLPKPLISIGVIVACVALVPPAFIAKARVSKSDQPRIHIIQDMDMQPKFKAQAPAPIFARLFGDERASLKSPAGTVARGRLPVDASAVSGKDANGDWVSGFPAGFSLSEEILARGRERYQIYCLPCHGMVGAGDGLVSQRADFLGRAQAAGATPTGMNWVKPANLAEQRIREQPNGQIYATITYGLNNMKGYAAQISREDRWAIVAYVRALQLSQSAALESLPGDVRAQLEQQPR